MKPDASASNVRTCSIAIIFALVVVGCGTASPNTAGSYPAMVNNTAGPMGLSLWCRQHYSEPRCAGGASNDLTGPQ
jgi:hypothetical protein